MRKLLQLSSAAHDELTMNNSPNRVHNDPPLPLSCEWMDYLTINGYNLFFSFKPTIYQLQFNSFFVSFSLVAFDSLYLYFLNRKNSRIPFLCRREIDFCFEFVHRVLLRVKFVYLLMFICSILILVCFHFLLDESFTSTSFFHEYKNDLFLFRICTTPHLKTELLCTPCYGHEQLIISQSFRFI